MYLLETVNYYMNIIIFATILIVAILGALGFYLIKVRKVTAAEEHINYNSFDRTSAMEYCKFDDIVSDDGMGMSGAGMIVVNDNTFVTGIDVVGYNYSHASAGEQQRTMMNGIAFANIIEQKIQMRQTVEAIDIQYNIDQFVRAKEEETKTLVELNQQYSDLLLQADAHKDDMDTTDIILNKLDELQRKISSCEWKIREAEEVISYEKLLQDGINSTNRINQIMFSYQYNPDEFTEELSKEEVYIKAMTALKSKISIYSNSLGNCGCSCKPLEALEIVELIRRHMHPNTADLVDVNDLINVQLDTFCVTSDSIYELEKEKIGERAYFDMIEENEAYVAEQVSNAEILTEKEIQALAEKAAEYHNEIIMEGELI